MAYQNTITIRDTLQTWDWVVFSLILLVTFLSVLYGLSLRKKSSQRGAQERQPSWVEYLLMGRQLTLPLFVATLVSTWYGKIFAVTQIAYENGVYSFLTQGIFWYVSYGLFAYFLARKIRQYKVMTLPALLAKLIGPGPAKFSALLVFIKTLPVAYAIGLGIFIEFLFGVPFFYATLIGIGFVIFYSLFGGFRAVVFSDLIQFGVMYGGLISIVVFSYMTFGGVSFLQENLPASHFSFTGSYSLSTTFVWFFIALSTTFLNPTFYQRCFAANKDSTASRGIWISIVFWIGFDLCQLLVGLYAKATLPDANPMNVCLTYALQVLPMGWKGFMLAAICATILSTLDSFLFISSTVLSYDLKIFKKTSPFQSHLYTLILTGLMTVLLTIVYEGHVETIWRTIKSFFAACLLVPILWNILFPRSIKTRDFALISLNVISSMIVWQWLKPFDLDGFYVGNGVALATALLLAWKRHLSKKDLGRAS